MVASYVLIQGYILSGSDRTDRRRAYYWTPHPMKEVKGDSKGKYHFKEYA